MSGGSIDIPGQQSGNVAGILSAAWAVVMSYRTESPDVVFGLQGPKGPCPIRVLVEPHQPVRNLLRMTSSVSSAVLASAVELAWIAGLSEDAKTACDLQTVLSINPTEATGGMTEHTHSLVIECHVLDKEISLGAQFDGRCVQREDVRLLLGDLEHLTWQLLRIGDDWCTVADLEGLSPASRRQILTYNRPLPRLPADYHAFAHQLVADSTYQYSDATAVESWDGNLTYADLRDKSDILAEHLSSLGVSPDVLVPVIFEKSSRSIVALLAVLKAGGGIVALDPSLPIARLHGIIADVDAKIVLSSALHQDKIPKDVARRVVVDALLGQLKRPPGQAIVHQSANPNNTMYVVFTSGSTGKPKGVMISHKAFCTCWQFEKEAIFLDQPTLRTLQYSSFAFDVSVLEIFGTLAAGGCVCVPSEEERLDNLVQCMARMRINWTMLTPSVAALLQPEQVPSLKVLNLAGEALPQSLADTWAPRVTLVNAYGPAECSIGNITSAPLVAGETIPLGLSTNCAIWIVDTDFKQLVPLGVVGEIVIEGDVVGTGYIKDEVRTKQAFLENPEFLKGVTSTYSRFYRTGDLGRMNSQGVIEYLGRKDMQVKIHGQRVELGEIEHQLRTILDDSLEVVVELIQPRQSDTSVLAAFFSQKHSGQPTNSTQSQEILFDGDHSPDKADIIRLTENITDRLKSTSLASYMIPKVILPCCLIPKSPTGKTDRKRLRALGASLTRAQLHGARVLRERPQPGPAQIQETLRRIWSNVLKLPETSIQPSDDFFMLGGDSISAIKVVGLCREAQLKINVATILRQSTLESMAAVCHFFIPDKVSAEPQNFMFLKDEEVGSLVSQAADQCNIEADLIEDLYPCTPMQEMLASASLVRPGAYVGQMVHPLPDSIDIVKFKLVWQEAWASSPILRTRFIPTSSGSLQAVTRAGEISWSLGDDLEGYRAADSEDYIYPGMAMCRFAIITESTATYFVLTIHHMISDGWSTSALYNRVNDLYNGLQVPPVEDFRKFVAYTQNMDIAESARFWESEFQDIEPSTFPVPAKPGYHSFAWASIEDHLAIRNSPSVPGITMPTVIRAAWSLMISHFTRNTEVLFGAVDSGRTAPIPNIDRIDGPTLATVPVRLFVRPDQRAVDFLDYVQNNAARAVSHAQFGLQRIRQLGDDGETAHAFQNLLVIQLPDWKKKIGPIGEALVERDPVPFPLTCEVWIQDDCLAFHAHIDEHLITKEVANRVISVLKSFLRQLLQLTESSELTTGDLHVGDDAKDQSPTTPEVNRTLGITIPKRLEVCVHDLISEVAGKNPNTEALYSTQGSVTYGELEKLTTRLANYLIGQGLRPGSIVPICFEKSIYAVFAMLGIIKAGSAFVPLNPEHPDARLRSIMQEVDAHMVLTSSLHAKTARLVNQCAVEINAEFFKDLPDRPLGRHASPDSLLYVLFTSGSTGLPKGVMIQHSAFATCADPNEPLNRTPLGGRFLQFSIFTFDASCWDIFGGLMRGSAICLPTEEERTSDLAGFMNRARVDYVMFTPSVARILEPSQVPTVRILDLGGEAPDEPLVAKWLAAGVEVLNGYGPTECSVIVSSQRLTDTMNCRNIGRPSTSIAWIVDPDDVDKLVPDGEIGELLVEGPTLAKGYLNDSEKTKKSFILDPTWTRKQGIAGPRRMYKTGDLVRRTPDGSMIYVQRKDNQVKVNGQRIELGEIESQLMSCQDVKLGIVAFPSTGLLRKQITAVVEIHKPSPVGWEARIKEELATKLPTIMVPGRWINVTSLPDAEFPLSSSGKIDRKRITSMPILPGEEPSWTLACKIRTLLAIKSKATMAEPFFDVSPASIGLDSLDMMSLLHFISFEFKVRISMVVLMDRTTTIRRLAAHITEMKLKKNTETRGRAIDLIAEIDRHDADIAAAQLEAPRTDARAQDLVYRAPRSRRRSKARRITVFLTGANGFLGNQILRQLLENRDVTKVIALVRGKDAEDAKCRLVEAATRGLWWTELHDAKLQVWAGDLSKRRLGLSPSEWRLLAEDGNVQVMIHNGAAVHWSKPYAVLEAVNVLSTLELIRIAVAGSHSRLIYVSGGSELLTSDSSDTIIAKSLAGDVGYSQTKFVADALVRRAAARCTPGNANLAVVRPGLVLGTPQEGVANTDDFIWRLASASVNAGVFNSGESGSWLTISDATTCASEIIQYALRPTAFDRDCVWNVEDGMTWEGFWSELQAVGYNLRPVQPTEWRSIIKSALASERERHPLWPVAHILDGDAEGPIDSSAQDDQDDPAPLHLRLAIRKNIEFLQEIGFLPATTAGTKSRQPKKAFTRGSLKM
ncbi:amino acid adenylation [Thozetella sp. PMI_491]|nr:amino acid adenylation [Thozetella sp. PMI_491]